MSFDRPSTDTEIDDKRQNVRQTLEAPVVMRIETENLEGRLLEVCKTYVW